MIGTGSKQLAVEDRQDILAVARPILRGLGIFGRFCTVSILSVCTGPHKCYFSYSAIERLKNCQNDAGTTYI